MVNLISPNNIAFPKITLESTLKDLNLYCCQLEITEEGRFALQLLNADPKLPGVILMDKEQLIGFISRQRILEQMSRPYGLELFLKRPLFQLYQYTKTEHLILSEETPITFAAQQVINRSSHLLNEPIIVEKITNNYALLDVHQLLIAHSNIFQLATSLLEENNQKLQRMAVIDPLTGIGNRRFFDQYFLRDWQLAIREKRWITVVMCDVDYFKKYNDTYGHPAGDECLMQASAVSYTTIVSLVPMLTVALAFLTITSGFNERQDVIFDEINTFFQKLLIFLLQFCSNLFQILNFLFKQNSRE
jgi:hypothetical protein